MSKRKAPSHKSQKLIKLISSNVVKLRKQNKWTQEQTAEKLGCDIRWYQRLESGEYNFSLETLSRLAELFKVRERSLLDF